MNKSYCASIGDLSQPTWADAPEWQKESARAGVLMVLSNPDTTPEQSHISWMKMKEEEGWVYGPEKIPELKVHPCMVAYDALPAEQRLKDLLYITTVKTMIRLTNIPETSQ